MVEQQTVRKKRVEVAKRFKNEVDVKKNLNEPTVDPHPPGSVARSSAVRGGGPTSPSPLTFFCHAGDPVPGGVEY